MSWGPHKDSQRCCDAFSLSLSQSLCMCGPYRLTAIGFRSGSTIMSHCFKMNYKLRTRSLNQRRVLRLLENYDEFVIKKKTRAKYSHKPSWVNCKARRGTTTDNRRWRWRRCRRRRRPQHTSVAAGRDRADNKGDKSLRPLTTMVTVVYPWLKKGTAAA